MNYDELVADPKAQLTEALKFLNLEWQEKLPKIPHIKKSCSNSKCVQIRKPLYKTPQDDGLTIKMSFQNIFEKLKLTPVKLRSLFIHLLLKRESDETSPALLDHPFHTWY